MRTPLPTRSMRLLSPAVLVALAVFVLNDHVLKRLYPGALTGKLSDFAFLFFAPVVLATLLGGSRLRRAVAFALPTTLLCAINLSPAASDAFAGLLSLVVPSRLWPDPTDLLALGMLPLAWWHLDRQARSAQVRTKLAHGDTLIAALAGVACMATSPARPPPEPPTHRAVCATMDEVREQVAVLPPTPIERRGKLLLAHDHIFLSDRGRGVHVIDNRNPREPRPVMFINIPGNVDVALDGDLLFADSFTDLLTFRLDLERGEARLVNRQEDQFQHDPMSAIDEDEVVLEYGHGCEVVIAAMPLRGGDSP